MVQTSGGKVLIVFVLGENVANYFVWNIFGKIASKNF